MLVFNVGAHIIRKKRFSPFQLKGKVVLLDQNGLNLINNSDTDLKFVKKFTRPNFRAKEFYTLKMRKSRLFSPAINSKNSSLSVIWPSFG